MEVPGKMKESLPLHLKLPCSLQCYQPMPFVPASLFARTGGLCSFLFARVYMCACMCGGICGCACACVWRPEADFLPCFLLAQ